MLSYDWALFTNYWKSENISWDYSEGNLLIAFGFLIDFETVSLEFIFWFYYFIKDYTNSATSATELEVYYLKGLFDSSFYFNNTLEETKALSLFVFLLIP